MESSKLSNPYYHVNKETQGIQQDFLNVNEKVKQISEKASPYLNVALSYSIRATLGYYSATRLGFTRSIPFVTIVNPGIGVVLMTSAVIIHVTAPDLNPHEDEEVRIRKSEQEEHDRKEDEKRSIKNQETIKGYFNNKVSPTGITKSMEQLSKEVVKFKF